MKGKSDANKSLVCQGLHLFQGGGGLREKEEAIGRESFGLVFVAWGSFLEAPGNYRAL